jgi:transposase InsO family protein
MASRCRHNHRSYQEKKQILEKYLLSNEYRNVTVKEFSRICGVPYMTLRRWGNTIGWDVGRIEELRRKTPKGCGRQKQSGISATLQDRILEIARDHRTWGPLKIKQYLWRHEQILTPQTSIYRLLKEHGLVKERVAEGAAGHDRRFEYPCPLAAVQLDLLQVILTSRQTIYLVTLLDDYSRYVLASRFTAVKTMDEVMDVFKAAVRTYGVMDRLLTDQGTEFVSWQRFTRFEELLADLDVEYIASGPHKKENQGKVERWHQTVREELRERGPLDCSSEAQLWIREVRDMYNYERPHQGIGGLLPADRFFGLREEIETELERCRAERRNNRQIYLVCRVGEQKLVVSGQGPEKLTVLLDGKRVRGETAPGEEEKKQLEKKAVFTAANMGAVPRQEDAGD